METIIVENERNILNPNSITFEEREKELKTLDELEEERRKREEKLRKNSPYNNWLQLNKDYYKAEDWLMAKSPIAYRIFKFLINNMDGYNSVICSYAVIQEYFGVSKPTITRAIKLLKEKKYIDVYKSGTSNVYCINKNIVWNSWGNNFKYAKFGANIILSNSEQEEIEEDMKEKNRVEIKTEKFKQVLLNENN